MISLYGSGMHDYVIREIEIGKRAAAYEDAENTFPRWTAIDDLILERDEANHDE